VEIVTLVHAHSTLMVAYLCLLIGLGAGLLAIGAPRRLMRRMAEVVGLVLAQGLIGVVQYHTGVPAVLVALHVAGAAACTAATAVLWASMRQRTEPEAIQSRLDVHSEAALP
jgi:cytochrome c oxidase assembly protein subunit 15